MKLPSTIHWKADYHPIIEYLQSFSKGINQDFDSRAVKKNEVFIADLYILNLFAYCNMPISRLSDSCGFVTSISSQESVADFRLPFLNSSAKQGTDREQMSPQARKDYGFNQRYLLRLF